VLACLLADDAIASRSHLRGVGVSFRTPPRGPCRGREFSREGIGPSSGKTENENAGSPRCVPMRTTPTRWTVGLTPCLTLRGVGSCLASQT
jgi:hypothetical protein